MKSRRVAMTISLPPDLAKNYEKIARREAKNKSQLFREMFSLYQTRAREKEFFELQREGARLAREKGILTEEDVEKIVSESRRN
jgi:metal-responsive CopG/Arc/MetJ family transcriptional regulator